MAKIFYVPFYTIGVVSNGFWLVVSGKYTGKHAAVMARQWQLFDRWMMSTSSSSTSTSDATSTLLWVPTLWTTLHNRRKSKATLCCPLFKMQKSEQLSVRWDDFQQNVRASFKELREDREFADVTLVCQDGKQFEVHKNILAASSPFFLDIFRTKKHPHPLVYLSGMKSQILVSVVDFIYYGEASVYQEDMEDFLALADELALKGLANKKETFKKNLPTSHIKESKTERGGKEQKKDSL